MKKFVIRKDGKIEMPKRYEKEFEKLFPDVSDIGNNKARVFVEGMLKMLREEVVFVADDVDKKGEQYGK